MNIHSKRKNISDCDEFKKTTKGKVKEPRSVTKQKTNGRNGDVQTVNFLLANRYIKVSLSKVRWYLVLSNLVTLIAAGVTMIAWRQLRKDLTNPSVNIVTHSEIIVKVVHTYLDQVLFLTSVNLLLYWLIYGLVLAIRFGQVEEMWILVVSVPHTIAMVLWEVGCAATVSRVAKHLAEMQPLPAEGPLDRFFLDWGPWIAAGYFASVPIQLTTMALPLFLVRNCSIREAEVSLTHIHMHTSNPRILTNYPIQYINMEKAKEAESLKNFEPDYVFAEKIEDLSYYTTEMPAEKLAKIKAMHPPGSIIRKVSDRSKIQGKKNILTHDCRALDLSITPQYGDYLSMGMLGYSPY